MGLTEQQFNELLLEQQDAVNHIFALSDDYIKANKERRAKLEYAKKIKNGLENQYNTLTLNHLILKDHGDKTNEYYTKKCFETTHEKYQRTMQLIDECCPPIVRQKKEQEKKDYIGKLVRKHAASCQIIRSVIARVMAENFETTEEIDYSINNLQAKIDDIAILHGEIYSIADLVEVEGYNFNAYNELETDVSQVIQSLIRKKPELKSFERHTKQGNGKGYWPMDLIQFPKLELPEFDGEQVNWPKFRDLFTDMVHNSTAAEAYKFYTLKSKLVGKAASMISAFNSHKDNYEAAWQRILEKYDNKKAVVFNTYERLFHQKNIKENNSAALHEFINTSKECLSILNIYDISFEGGESAVLFLLLEKLDQHTRLQYELTRKDPKTLPGLEEFFVFLELRAQALQAYHKTASNMKATTHISTGASASNVKCICCEQESHRLRDCSKFRALSVQARRVFVKEKGLCFNCMRAGHLVTNCDWSGCPIQGCSAKHNSMLHQKPQFKEKVAEKEVNTLNINTAKADNQCEVSFQSNLSNCNSGASSKSEEDTFIFLGTSMIYIDDKHGNKIICRALIDSGSQVNIMTKSLWRKLGLEATFYKTTLDGIGSNSITTSNRVNFNFTSTNLKFNQQVEALVLPKITTYLPSESIKLPGEIYENYNLADPSFNRPESIDVLLGADICMDIFKHQKVSLGEGLPLMKETELGWIVMGKYTRGSRTSHVVCGITTEEQNFHLLAPTLWEMEDLKTPRSEYTIEEEICEHHFKTNTFRNSDGKFVVSLPKFSDRTLGNSFQIALRRFKYLEKRFQRDSNLFNDYKNFLEEYVSLGHMKEVFYEHISKGHCFLTHHPVVKESSTTTKLRDVFDASAKTSNNVS